MKYVRGNFWPSVCFGDDADLNRQAQAWCDGIANERVHGTTGRVPKVMLGVERSSLGALPERSSLSVYLREDRKVGRDGYVAWDGSWYGVPWSWAGSVVQVRSERRNGSDMEWTGAAGGASEGASPQTATDASRSVGRFGQRGNGFEA